MSTPEPEPTEAELRAAYEAEIKKIRVEQVLLEQVVTLVNLGMRRTGLAPGTEAERDPEQVRLAIDAIRALLPMLEQSAPQQIPPIREALSQLQFAFVELGQLGQLGQLGHQVGGEAAHAGAATAPGAGEAPPGTSEPASETPPGASQAPPESPPTPSEPPEPGQPGPAQRSGRLWIPGQ
ncbi:MAG: hypothetical protein ACR2OB_10225 [Solirubrobacteraceae bacterium]